MLCGAHKRIAREVLQVPKYLSHFIVPSLIFSSALGWTLPISSSLSSPFQALCSPLVSLSASLTLFIICHHSLCLSRQIIMPSHPSLSTHHLPPHPPYKLN